MSDEKVLTFRREPAAVKPPVDTRPAPTTAEFIEAMRTIERGIRARQGRSLAETPAVDATLQEIRMRAGARRE